MNTPVSYKLAKLLKEKGFDKGCVANWWILAKDHSDNYKNNQPLDESKIFFAANREEYDNMVQIDNDTEHNAYHVLGCPTIAEVVMWLYEKRGIWVAVDAGINGFHAHYKVNPIGRLSSNLKQGWVNDESNPLPSPKEAYETAIKYCLTKLI